MSFGEVDTLNMLMERLDTLFNESQGYYEGFLDANTLYKAGKLSDKEFFAKMGDYIVAYSALEFLGIKVIFEIKKTLDKASGGATVPTVQSPGGMHGISLGGMAGGMPGGMPGAQGQQPRMGTPEAPVGSPPGIVSAGEGFTQPGTLPAPDPSLLPRPQGGSCNSCGGPLRENAKFCTKCGART
ncbi:hypothetical protein CENSYa_0026 [Cenarchaeum symbiosum A]|uniref:Zinc-ribbon domain-containing protein n=1 Tax=Cenarchaeum symbiosum (strain A) TaxID=414004 RepID=A0RTL7_CENSY|nr:hypothetical protein CENSYa_0026 [Cenarchaeum symbiosum A]